MEEFTASHFDFDFVFTSIFRRSTGAVPTEKTGSNGVREVSFALVYEGSS